MRAHLYFAQSISTLALSYHIRGRLTDAIQLYQQLLSSSNNNSTNNTNELPSNPDNNNSNSNNTSTTISTAIIEQGRVWGLAGTAQSFLLRNEFEKALVLLKEAEELCDKQSISDRFWIRGMLALALEMRGDTEIAEQYNQVLF